MVGLMSEDSRDAGVDTVVVVVVVDVVVVLVVLVVESIEDEDDDDSSAYFVLGLRALFDLVVEDGVEAAVLSSDFFDCLLGFFVDCGSSASLDSRSLLLFSFTTTGCVCCCC